MATEFNAAFLEARMQQHRRFQHDLEAQYVNEIIDEVQALPKRGARAGELFSMLPDPGFKPLRPSSGRDVVVCQ